MYTLELVIAGLALIWGPVNSGDPATVYFPKADSPAKICGYDMNEVHDLVLVFKAEDLDDAYYDNDYSVRRVAGVDYGVWKIQCQELTISSPDFPTLIEKELGNCDTTGGPIHNESYACVANVNDIYDSGGQFALDASNSYYYRRMAVAGGRLTAFGIAADQYDQPVPWRKPGRGAAYKDALAQSVKLTASQLQESVEITGSDCNGPSQTFGFRVPSSGKLEVWISNLPRKLSDPGAGTAKLRHFRWLYPLLKDMVQPLSGCNEWTDVIDAMIDPDRIVILSGASGVFCPPLQGP